MNPKSVIEPTRAYPYRGPLPSRVFSNDNLIDDSGGIAAIGSDRDVPAHTFRDHFREHPAGVAVVTAESGGRMVAMTATSVVSVSMTPPILTMSLSNLSSSSPVLLSAPTVVVHLLDRDHLDLASLCATGGVDRFADTSTWSRLPTGEPRFLAPRRWIRGRVINEMHAGASTVVAVRALDTETDAVEHQSPGPLVYHNRTWHSLGDESRLPAS